VDEARNGSNCRSAEKPEGCWPRFSVVLRRVFRLAFLIHRFIQLKRFFCAWLARKVFKFQVFANCKFPLNSVMNTNMLSQKVAAATLSSTSAHACNNRESLI
jgi:hypothetical protein